MTKHWPTPQRINSRIATPPNRASIADVLVTLNAGHRPNDDMSHDLRLNLREEFPDVIFLFAGGPRDQILNFGLRPPIDFRSPVHLSEHRKEKKPVSPTNCCVESTWFLVRLNLRIPAHSTNRICASMWTGQNALPGSRNRRRHHPTDLSYAVSSLRRLLAQSQERRELFHRDPTPHYRVDVAGSGEHSGHGAQRRPVRRFWLPVIPSPA